MEHSPCLLSLGQLCLEDGFTYHWAPGANPIISNADGIHLECQYTHNVPHITSANACPNSSSDAIGDDQLEPPEIVEEDKAPATRMPGEVSPEHCLTHFPKDPRCPICSQCKTQRTRHGKRKQHGEPDHLPEPQKFADAITADHAILSTDEYSRSGDTVSMIVLDRKTGWAQAFPAPTKSSEEVKMAFQRFLGPGVKPGHIYTDGSGEFQKSCEEL